MSATVATGGRGSPRERSPAPEPTIQVHFLGTATPRGDLDRLSVNDRFPHTAANELQWSYIEALRSADCSVHVTSAPAISEYPRFPRVLATARRLGLARHEAVRFIPFVNVMGLKQVSLLVTAAAAMWPQMWRSRNERSVVVVYALQSPFLLAGLLFRVLFGNPLVLIVPDLPEYMQGGSGPGLRALLKSIDVRLVRRLLRHIDGALVIASAIGTDCLAPGTPYLVVDSIREAGGAPAGAAPKRAEQGPRAVLYSGGLYEAYGVGTLLDAFRSIDDPGYELWLAGKGELEGRIRAEAERDPRIRYLGQLPVAELRRVQANAALLVSVKPSRERFTKYSFPSKITEYMASGRPVATTETPAIAEEYYRYIHRLADDDPEAMKRSLLQILRVDPAILAERARGGLEFIRSTRSPGARGNEIVGFLRGLCSR